MIPQLSVFLENRPGRISELAACLAAAGINILTMSLADTEQFGILRLIVREWEEAARLLRAEGWVVKMTEVLAVEVPDCPGGLAGVLAVFEEAGLNIEYMYAFTFRRRDHAIIVFRLDQPEAAAGILGRRDVAPLDFEELLA